MTCHRSAVSRSHQSGAGTVTHCSYYLLCVIVSLSAILSDDLPDEYFIRYYVCCLPKHVMDDWKLKTPTVVRIERSNKTFVYFVFLSVCLSD